MFEFLSGVVIGMIIATFICAVEDIKYEENENNDFE